MRLGHVALRDGQEAGQAGLGGEQVVVRGIEASRAFGVGEAIPDREDAALGIVEETEVHAVRQGAGPVGQAGQPFRAQAFRERHQGPGEVSAVDGGDVARQERSQGPRVVPVQEVALVPFQPFDRVEGLPGTGRQLLPLDEAEVVGGQRRQKAHADVRRRGAMRDAGLRHLLHVVRRQAVVFVARERLEVPPGVSRDETQALAVLRSQLVPPDGDGAAQLVGDERRGRPQHQHRPGGGQRGRTHEHDEGHAQRGQDRAGPHLPQEQADAGAVGAGGGGRRLPFQHPALGDGQAHEGEADGVDHLVGLVGEEGQLQGHLRQRRPRLLPHAAQEHGRRLMAPRSGQRAQQERIDGERQAHEHGRRPRDRVSGQEAPGREEEGDGGRGQKAAPEVVEDLPPRDEREAIALPGAAPRRHEREQPHQDLPVAPHPAPQAAGVGQQAGGIVVHDLEVGDEGGARVDAFEQVVGQERVLGHAAVEGLREGGHVVEALAREDPFREEVLVRVRDGGGVGIDAGVAGVDAREQRSRGAGHGDADARLKDAVALRDPAQGGVVVGTVERVGDDADEPLGHVAGQARVRVQRDAVADGGQDLEGTELDGVARVGGPAQQAVEFLDLPPLALPAHPGPFARVPLAPPMEQEEAVAPPFGQAAVQGLDALLGRGQDRLVLGQVARGRVREVAQDREVDVRVEVAEGEDLDVLHQLLDLGHAGEQRGHDHHRPLVRRDALPELEAREPPRGGQPRGQPLHERDGHVAGGQEQEQRHRRLHPRGRAVPSRISDPEAGDEEGEDGDRAEVGAGGVAEHEAPHALAQPRPVGHVRLEVPAALADEVVADVGGAVTDPCALRGLPRALHGAEADAHLGLARRVRELFHGLAIAVAAQEVHASVPAGRILLEHALHEAHRFEVLAPVEGRAQAQAGDHVRHRHLRRRLALVLAADGVFRSHVLRGQVLFHGRAHRAQARAVLADALQDLDHERGVEDGGQRGHRPLASAVDLGHVGVGGSPCRAALQDLFGQAAQVLDEGQLEHAGPGPQLADGEGGHGLEGVHEAHELGPVQAAVAVADDLHRHRVHARRPRLLT